MDPRRTVTRRHVVQGGAAIATSGIAAARLRPAGSVRSRQADGSIWKPSDGLRLAGPVQDPESLDPALARDLATNFILRQVFRSLVRFDTELRPVPELAESVAVSNDSLTYRVTLRASARFHDGRAIEAEDVLESLSRALRPETAGGSTASLPGSTYLGDIEGANQVLTGVTDMLAGVVALDSRTVDITLAQPSATFLMKLASVPGSIVDRHQSVSGALWDAPNGSGPFQLTSWVPGQAMTLEAADTWWTGTARVPAIDIRIGSSASQPLNLYQAGEIDLVQEIPPDQAPLVADTASGIAVGDLIETDLFAVSYIAFGNRTPPLDDLNVRRAIRLAFPASNIARAMFNGAVREAHGLIPDGMLQTMWAEPHAPVDIAAAKEALSESRYGAAARVPPIPIHGADVAALEALRDTLRDALGLTIEVISLNWPDFLAGLVARRFPAYALYWGVDYPDPENLLWTLFGSESPENYSGYYNPDFDALMADARTTLDQAQRAAIYADAHRALLDDVAVIPLYFDRRTTLVRAGVGGLDVTPMGILGLETIGPST